MRRIPFLSVAIALAAALAGDSRAETGATWLVVTTSVPSPQGLSDALGRIGGTIEHEYPEIGTIVVTADDQGFRTLATAIPGVSSVVPNVPLAVETAGEGAGPAPASDPLFAFQWGLHAIDAEGAWNQGYTGAGARVAVLDKNFDLTHPDLAPNLNAGLAVSFVPGETVEPPPGNPGSHGTITAGIIAATANGIGTVGIAPDAEIIPIKVMTHAGFLTLASFVAGMDYATSVRADVASMSFITRLPKSGFCFEGVCLTKQDVREIERIVARTCRAARRSGMTLVASAGNDSSELDRNDDIFWLPAETKGVIAVSATGPNNFLLDPGTDLDVPTTYTNFGRKVVHVAAPGGQFNFDPEPVCDVGLGATPCSFFDLVLTTQFPSTYGFGAGTSMSTPFVAGVVALMVGKHGGDMRPSQVERILRETADDLGPFGRDDYFGWGRVNSSRAVEKTPAM